MCAHVCLAVLALQVRDTAVRISQSFMPPTPPPPPVARNGNGGEEAAKARAAGSDDLQINGS